MGCATSQDEKRQKEVCLFRFILFNEYIVVILAEVNYQ
jgi:hypothetical protein